MKSASMKAGFSMGISKGMVSFIGRMGLSMKETMLKMRRMDMEFFMIKIVKYSKMVNGLKIIFNNDISIIF